MTTLLTDYNYQWVLVEPVTVGAICDAQPSMPALTEPSDQPLVLAPVAEPLVAVEHRNIRVLSTYWHAGWAGAQSGAWLRVAAASRLNLAADMLPAGFGFAVMDAWRPLDLQQAIYDAAYADDTLPAGFVSVPSQDPQTPPPHLTGGTVDVTLTYNGHALRLGTDFDDFDELAYTAAFELYESDIRDLRRLLYWSLRRVGFTAIDCEWWHFEYGTRRWAALTGNTALYGPASLA